MAWSPDSRFLAVGGQDDLITLLSPRESRVVARCQGHSAFVASIAFDPGRGEGRGYRFASVGEDGKLILVRPFLFLRRLPLSRASPDGHSGISPLLNSIDRGITMPIPLITELQDRQYHSKVVHSLICPFRIGAGITPLHHVVK